MTFLLRKHEMQCLGGLNGYFTLYGTYPTHSGLSFYPSILHRINTQMCLHNAYGVT